MKALTRFCCFLIILGIVALAGCSLYERRISTEFNNSQAAHKIRYQIDEAGLGQTIEATIANYKAVDISVTLSDLQTGKRYKWGNSDAYTAASITKLITAATYLYNVELGRASLEDRIGQHDAHTQLHKLIVKSDNTAWQLLNKVITKERLQTYATLHGLNSYSAADNTITSADITTFMEKLAAQKLLNKTHTELLLSLMENADMRNYIVSAVPDTAKVYHKVGYLADRVHDTAIIRQGERSYVLTIFSKSPGTYDFYAGTRLFGEITRSTTRIIFNAERS